VCNGSFSFEMQPKTVTSNQVCTNSEASGQHADHVETHCETVKSNERMSHVEKDEGVYRWRDIEAHDLDIAASAEACLVTRYFVREACRQNLR
jgi:hypothetical protein